MPPRPVQPHPCKTCNILTVQQSDHADLPPLTLTPACSCNDTRLRGAFFPRRLTSRSAWQLAIDPVAKFVHPHASMPVSTGRSRKLSSAKKTTPMRHNLERLGTEVFVKVSLRTGTDRH